MADVTQLSADLIALQTAVADDAAAITQVKAFVESQAAEIANLEQQLAAVQSANGGNLDLSGLEASIASLKDQNAALGSIVVSPSSQPLTGPVQTQPGVVTDNSKLAAQPLPEPAPQAQPQPGSAETEPAASPAQP